ncbi:diguanylate cyclase domain-containing protein [Roseomonas sp. 18066]|uniref:sensor domain-containing diguanylate cyclase n=1 Tax=Roseomonas sp. 18066 TaxID=2681412 RepID=UPI00135B99B9|nr:diguanylate cyclase [Roseomonas sp. 18066]
MEEHFKRKHRHMLEAALRPLRTSFRRITRSNLEFSSLSRGSVTFTLLVCFALVGLEGWTGWRDYHASVQRATTANSNLAQSLVQHTEDVLDRADTVLAQLVERVTLDGTGPALRARLDDLLRREAERPPGALSFFVYGADGGWLASSLPQTPGSMSNADREYFRRHRESADPQPYLGPLVISRSRGKWILTLSRRVQASDGRFAGVVLATIDAEYFSGFFSRFELGRDGAAALFRTDGTLLTRQPFIESQAGRNFADLALFRQLLPRAPAGTNWITSPFDGVTRLNSYRRAERYPLVIAVAVSEQEALAVWRREIVIRSLATALVMVVIGFLGLRISRQAQRRHQVEKALAESEGSFRLLAENSSDMVSRINLEGKRTYVSPAAERLLGLAAATLIGRPANEFIDAEDQPAVEQAMGRLRTGELREATVTFRLHRAGQETLWLESAIRTTHDPRTGEADGAVAVSRDVTERRLLEQRLAELASTDGLTGLANRRAFDDALQQEWRRSTRTGQPLSLLLLDVDRFKQYNDSYGHQQGDECLKAVALAVRSMIRRAGDVAARYGGEEMVLLLPNTATTGGEEVAEKLRAALQAQRLPHAANIPFGVVTASIGVAGVTPELQAEIGPGALVAAADSALYRAKHEGRNRVVLAT